MKYLLTILLLFSVYATSWAQLETTNSFKIDAESELNTANSGLSLGAEDPKELEKRFPLYNSLRDSLGFNRTHQPFSMHSDNGLLSPEANATPKWFEKDKPVKDEYKSDQYLGDFKSNSEYIHLVYRDHESVDGDLVRVFVNDDVIRSQVFLGASFQSIKINMVKGFNRIDILALNQGDSGPNTAEFHLYDDKGNIITANEWNLTTGVKATMIVVKE